MNSLKNQYNFRLLQGMLLLLVVMSMGCRVTRHVPEGKYLLRKNSVKVKSDKGVTRAGDFNDQLRSLVAQKANTYELGFLPFKLWVYNARYNKYKNDSVIRAKGVEKPVIYDSALKKRTVQNMYSFLRNQGYFYARVYDTTRFKHNKKAYVSYRVETGTNYLLNKNTLDIDDSVISQVVSASMESTVLKNGTEFTFSMLDEERSRIGGVLRNAGYYKFSQDNISFILDTLNKSYFRNAENPFESAINFIALQKQRKKPTLDVRIIIRADDDRTVYDRYVIGKVSVYPDFVDRNDLTDSTMIQTVSGDVTFRYHKYYVHENVILKHIYFVKGELYSQDNYDQTISKLNDLGIFQYVRVYLLDDTSEHEVKTLRCVILLNPAKRYDVFTNFEVSNGSTYALGSAISIGFRNRNLLKGGNQYSITASGGVESGYSPLLGDRTIDHFYLLSRNLGLNGSLILPKFLAPVNKKLFNRYNLPRTVVGLGFNLLDRLNYFTLTNTTANFTYNWKQSQTVTWDLTPAFINILRLPRISDSFQKRLDENQFLRNSYKQNFIEGENLNYTFTDQGKASARFGYSYVKLGIEEAGAVLSFFNEITKSVENPLKQYAQYVKFDFDARHYFTVRNAVAAFRFYGGVGVPYDKSTSLPYVKQYFVGGAYSIRGWRVRNLGPGGSPPDSNVNFIDRTGDIKLELNGEYRFPIVQLFSNAIKFNGAVFADAGNVWLSQADPQYPNGEFNFNRLGRDIAMSSGIGARFDIGGFLTLRLDGAFPLKKPYVSERSGWVIHKIDLGDSHWRDQNIILNIAIGYPF